MAERSFLSDVKARRTQETPPSPEQARAGSMRRLKVCLLTNQVTPYRYPVWKHLAGQVALDIIVLSQREKNRIWDMVQVEGLKFQVLRGWSFDLPRFDAIMYYNLRVFRHIFWQRPDVVIMSGYENFSYLKALLACQLLGIPVVIWWGSHQYSSRSGGWGDRFKRWIFGRASHFITYGTLSARYLQSLGIPASSITVATNSVDTQHMAFVPKPSGKLRLLYVGRLTEAKGIREMLQGIERHGRSWAGAFALTIVGYGPLEGLVKDFIADHPELDITYAGATRNETETGQHYQQSHVLIMPSWGEVWGLVVNEALAYGCYVVAASTAGATFDLIEQAPLPVGHAYPPRDVEQLADALHKAQMLYQQNRMDFEAISNWGHRITTADYAEKLHVAACEALKKEGKT